MPAMMARSSRFIPTIAKRSSRDAEDLCVNKTEALRIAAPALPSTDAGPAPAAPERKKHGRRHSESCHLSAETAVYGERLRGLGC